MAGFIGLASSHTVKAEVLNFTFTGSADYFDVTGDPSGLPLLALLGGVTPSSPTSGGGSFSYDTNATGLSGIYHTGKLSFSFPPLSVSGGGFTAIVNDAVDPEGGVFDQFSVAGAASQQINSNQYLSTSYQLFLIDRSAAVFSSDALPTSLSLANFDDTFLIYWETMHGWVDGEPTKIGEVAVGIWINSITQVAPVPEPSTWAMLMIGFAALGYAGYRRRERLDVSAAGTSRRTRFE